MSDEMWSYGDDGWKRVPHYWSDEVEREEEALQQAGYSKYRDETWGYPPDGSVDIFQHTKDRERWLVELTIGSSSVHTIEVRGLPNLLELTAKLGIFTLASQMSRLHHEVESAIDLLVEDKNREYQRRHPST